MNVQVVIIGAGAAGIAAAKRLQKNHVSFCLIEAGNHVGGRAVTEILEDGRPFDLGCHWMHSASLNPFVNIADSLGIQYQKRIGYGLTHIVSNGVQLKKEDKASVEKLLADNSQRMTKLWAEGQDISVMDALGEDREWASISDYFTVLETSSDVDQVSIGDLINYHDTNENWPVIDGYGALIQRWAADVPVALDTRAKEIHWGGGTVRVTTTKGDIRASRVILTVSTSVLSSGTIRFVPGLPERKKTAIASLPLGNYNRIRLKISSNAFDKDTPERIIALSAGEPPMALSIRPYNFDCVVGIVGGRYADWLERLGSSASTSAVETCLSNVFGNDILKRVTGDRQSAWRGNPFVRGAYSAALPGQFFQRARLAEPIDDKLYFAGEATSINHFCTCHGAMMTGDRAAKEIM